MTQEVPELKQINIAINGFGRIGRLFLRLLIAKAEQWRQENKFLINIVAINNPGLDPDYAAYKFKFDTKHGQFKKGTVSHSKNSLIISTAHKTHHIEIFNERDPEFLPWANFNIDYVIESTGIYTNKQGASKHIIAGAKKVIITAPSKDCPVYVMGVNENQYNSEQQVISNASCTTNCLAPLMKIINDNLGIEEALMTTVHSMTASQKTVDGTSKKDWRGGRTASENIIPSSTGAAKMVGIVIPELHGKLTGMSLRIPTTDVSIIDVTIKLLKPVKDMSELNELIKVKAKKSHGVIGYTEDAVVSSDFISDEHSCVYDANAGIRLSEKFVKILAWYDNEYGYSARVVDLLCHAIKVDNK